MYWMWSAGSQLNNSAVQIDSCKINNSKGKKEDKVLSKTHSPCFIDLPIMVFRTKMYKLEDLAVFTILM